ncbi:DUF3558 family protein [Amycolatopsis sp., V23-08]|uniref:DUF3558 family protein n=1 Tax=Amycolatopsis heterodermiae TaxID=3110235 RepID=A0ABU5QZX6_9PSEU|nr:DUF3558 family protein [Amycolatopsis sp., V23-08]MEA5358984.1 DUF3558 family protein [Amycolatopsis sp., V23-08]
MTVRRPSVAIAALILALGLTACTSQVGGQANPSQSGSGTSTPTSASATDDPGNPFAGLSPCTVLDQVLTGQGFPKAAPTIADAKETCGASKDTSGNTPGVTVGLSLQAGGNYKDNVTNPQQASDGNVNGRPAVEEREPQHSPGQCAVRFQVKQDSRALLVISSGSDTATACKQAEEIAAKVEPLLPKN